MDYEQAKRIRNKDYSLSKLITTNIRQGAGAGAAIKGAFKEKFDFKTRTQAKITGIKERFDPLNIAKFLTGGSNFAPALLGRMLGRSQKDINYFSGGRAKPYENATKIGKVEGDESGMTDILDKIYTFMKKSQEDDIKHQELQNNHREEEMMKADKKHKELLKALSKLTGNATAERVSGQQDSGSDILAELMAAWPTLSRILGFFTTGLGVPLLGFTAIAAFWIWGQKEAMASAKSRDEAAAKGDLDALRKQVEANTGANEGGELGSVDERMKSILQAANTPEAKAALAKLESGTDKNSDAYKEKFNQSLRDQGYKKNLFSPGYSDSNNKPPTPEALAIADDFASGKKSPAATQPATETPAGAPTTPAAEPTPPTPNSAPAPTSATPAESTNPGQQLVNATNENNNAKLADLTESPATNTVNTSNTNVGGKSSVPKHPLPPVRNLEETFQRMIMNSTRVV